MITIFSSIENPSVRDMVFFCGIFQEYLFSADNISQGCFSWALVIRLGFYVCPSTIVGFIVSVIIYSVNRKRVFVTMR